MGTPRVLVTGCAGYIGSILTPKLLTYGCKVIGVDNLSLDNGRALFGVLGHPNFEFHRLDVREARLLADLASKCDVVMPLAALVGAPVCEKNPKDAFEVNHIAITTLVRGLSQSQRVVFPNTNSGYGQTDGASEVTENDPMEPVSVYGHSKCLGERAVLEHPNSMVLRLATVFGASPRMRFDLMVNDFTRRLCVVRQKRLLPFFRERMPATLKVFEPHFKRNFVGIRDVAKAFVILVGKQLRGVYNFGLPAANLTKMELAHFVCDRLGLPHEVVVVGEGQDPDRRNYLVSNEKILKTGFEFGHALERGVDEVIAAWRAVTEREAESMRNA